MLLIESDQPRFVILVILFLIACWLNSTRRRTEMSSG
jgi:hypothetical protein